MMRSTFTIAGLLCCMASSTAYAQAGLEHIFDAPEGSQLKGVAVAADHSVYAVLSAGGPDNLGTLVRYMPDGQVFVLHAFSAADHSRVPNTAPVFGSDGMLYGTTSQGGAHGFGTLYQLDDCNELQTVHDFTSDDGGPAVGPLLPAADGGFYAVTYGLYDANPNGGQYGEWGYIQRSPGKVIHVSSAGSSRVLAQWLTQPNGGVILASDGYLYGTQPRVDVWRGSPVAVGHVYRVKPDGSDYGSSGNYQPIDFNPGGQVTEGPDGHIYGVSAGGSQEGPRTFRIETNFATNIGGGYSEVALEGGVPGGLVFGTDGHVYGASSTFFRATPTGVVTHIHEINGATPPPTAAMQLHPDGDFVVPSGDHLLRLTQAGGVAVLHRFGYRDGAELRELWQAKDGRVYGMTGSGGANGAGTLFRFEADGTLHTLASWPGWVSYPWQLPLEGTLSEGLDGTLYGVLDLDDAHSVFSVSTSGELRTLHTFTGRDAPYRYFDLGWQVVQGVDGALYGTLSSWDLHPEGGYIREEQLFRLDLESGEAKVLARAEDYSFYHLLPAADGSLFTLTWADDFDNRRYALRRVASDGQVTTLHEFSTDDTGHNPAGNLVAAADGSIYGYARARSPAAQNIIYRWTRSTGLVIEHNLSSTETYQPKLVLAEDGTLVGTNARPYTDKGVFIVRPSGELIKHSDPGLGTLVTRDGSVYRIEPITRGAFSGFRLEPLSLPN